MCAWMSGVIDLSKDMKESNALSAQLSIVSLSILVPPFFHCSLTMAKASAEGVSWLNLQVLW